jgi:hypothetical protein
MLHVILWLGRCCFSLQRNTLNSVVLEDIVLMGTNWTKGEDAQEHWKGALVTWAL